MFPYAFHDDKKEKGLFDLRPELEEFKKFGKRMVRDSDKNNKENKGTNVRPCNSNYKTEKGETYGLYQRFYWDESNVPFAGRPNY